MSSATKKNILFALILLGVGILVYCNALNAKMAWDDGEFILNNPLIRYLENPTEMWDKFLFGHRKRFVVFFSFAINYYFSGNSPWGYHLVNVLIHLVTTLLVFWFIRLLLSTPRLKNQNGPVDKSILAFLVALLFEVHPLQTQAVTYISQRFTSMATLFYILSLCFYLKGRLQEHEGFQKSLFLCLAFLAILLGMFSKEIVFTLPLMILLIDKTFFSGHLAGPPVQAKKTASAPSWKSLYLLPFLLLLFIIPALFSFDIKTVFTMTNSLGLNSWNYFCTELRVIVVYLRLLFLPIGQNVDYDFTVVGNFFHPLTFGAFALLAGIITAAIYWRKRYPLVSFGIFWFFLALSVESSIIPIQDVIFEHRVYLPSVGFFLAVVVGISRWIRDSKKLVAFLCVPALIFAFLAHQRNNVWSTEVSLWEDTVKKSPLKARPHANLGQAYRHAGKHRKSINQSLIALKILGESNAPVRAQIYVNLGSAYLSNKDMPSARDAYLEAIKLNPNNVQAHTNLGYIFKQLKKPKLALQYALKATELDPTYAEAYINLGMVYGTWGDYPKAIESFQRALSLSPRNMLAKRNLDLAKKLLAEKQQ